MLKPCLFAATALPFALLTVPARAQDAPPKATDQSDQQVVDDTSQDIVGVFSLPNYPRSDIIITATGVEEMPEKIGQAVTVIDRATIERRQTVALSDLLATTPGVTVTRNGGLGGFTAVRIRGAEGEQTLTLIDGVRVNDPSSPGGGFDFANLLAGSIDRVEILRGPNSVPWGSQAIGGVVNVVTATPPGFGWAQRGNIEYGSNNSVFANAGVSGKSGIVNAAFNAGYLKTDGISAAASGSEPDGYRQYGATGRVEVALAGNVKLDLRGYYADSKVDIDGFPPPYFTFADTPQYSKAQELYGYAGLNADFLDGRFRNRLAVTIGDINRDNFDPSQASPRTSFFRGRSERYEYQGDFRVIDQVRVVFGAGRENTHYFDYSKLRATRGVTSLYGEAILSPVDRLTVTGGVRYGDDSAYGGHTVWGANAVYTLPTGTTLRGSYAQGFKAPTLYQLYAPFYGNPLLKPESAESYDVGIEQKLVGDRIVVSLTWFHRDTTNQISYDPTTFVNYNLARTRAKGIEFGLTARPTDRLTLDAAYSFIDARSLVADQYLGYALARRPRQAISASIDWKTPIGLGIGATVQNVGSSLDVNFDPFPAVPVRLKDYVLLGVRADFPIGDRFSIYGRIDNVFDAKYRMVYGYATPGRAAYGGVRVKFQ